MKILDYVKGAFTSLVAAAIAICAAVLVAMLVALPYVLIIGFGALIYKALFV